MKHNIKITIILLCMFLIAQLIGLGVVSQYLKPEVELPYGMEPPEEATSVCSGLEGNEFLFCILKSSILISVMFAVVILIVFFLMKRRSVWFMP